METLNKDAMSKITQLIGLLVQSFAIIALATTFFMFVDRLVVCIFYRLPIVYNSLDLIRAVPVAAALLFMLFYLLFILLGFSMIGNDTKKIFSVIQEGVRSVSDKESIRIIALLNSMSASMKKYLSKIKIQKKEGTKNVKDQKDKKTSDITKDILNLQTAIYWTLIFTVAWRYFLSKPLSEKLYFYLDNIGGFCLFGACIIETIYMIKILKKMKKEISHVLNKRKTVDSSGSVNTIRQDVAIGKRITMCIICVFALICTCIITIRIMYLNDKTIYGIVEIYNRNDQAYAVVLNIDEHYVLEPVEEEGDELIIKADQHMYVNKDEILVSYKEYKRVRVLKTGMLFSILNTLENTL